MTTDLRTVGHSKFDRILILTCGRWSFSVGSDAETTLRNATTSRSLLSLFFVITVFLQKKVWSETERKTNNVRGKSHRCSRTSLSHFFRRKRAKKNQNSCRPVSHGSTSTSLKYPSYYYYYYYYYYRFYATREHKTFTYRPTRIHTYKRCSNIIKSHQNYVSQRATAKFGSTAYFIS